MAGKRIVFTIGHSNRTFEDFAALLTENKIELLADVRTVPRSRTNPQFNKETFAGSLAPNSIDYIHLPELGGLRGKRKSDKPSENTYWENSSFRNYADYAETEPFREGLERLIALAREKRTAYMCSEAVWWRCHRRIITDYMLARGFTVRHIMALGKTDAAEMNEHAIVEDDGRIVYPADQQELHLEL